MQTTLAARSALLRAVRGPAFGAGQRAPRARCLLVAAKLKNAELLEVAQKAAGAGAAVSSFVPLQGWV